MPTFDYIESQNDALEIIAEFGVETFIAEFSSFYDPVEEIETNRVTSETPATVVSLPGASLTGISNFDNRFKSDLVKGKVRLFFVAAKGLLFRPDSGQSIIFDGYVWDIIGSTPLNPAGIPVMYSIACNQSVRTNWKI